MENIIFIAYEFAPYNIAGAFRSMFFVKHLRKFGINPIVVCLSPDSLPEVVEEYSIDQTMLDEIPKDIEVRPLHSSNILDLYTTKIKRFTNMYFELHGGKESEHWEPSFSASIANIVSKSNPKAIYVTVPPFSMLQCAYRASIKYNLPLIIDSRDHWLGWRTTPFASYLHYYFTKKMEEKYFKHAKAIIGPTPEVIAGMLKYHPHISPKKFKLIYNGFEGTRTDWELPKSNPSQPKITIGYVGSFYFDPRARESMLAPWYKRKPTRLLHYRIYKEDYLYRSPYFFFKAISHLFHSNPTFKEKIEIKFIGTIPNWLPKMVAEFDLEQNCLLLGQLSKDASWKFQQSCDYLLVTSSKIIDGRAYTIASKTYEYFKNGKPVIGFVPEGSQKDIILKSGLGIVCDPDNILESKNQLLQLFEGKTKLFPNVNFLTSFSREQQANQLATIIHETIRTR